MATVETVDVEGGRVTLQTASDSREVETDAATRIWWDRTALGESKSGASLSVCREGHFVEVKLDSTGRRAEWIKLRAPGGR
jgi:hypothetical protein